MKKLILTLVWTIVLLSFGFIISFKAEIFANKYSVALDKLEIYVKNEDWEESKNYSDTLIKNFEEESKHWFKLLNHCYLGDVELSFKILEDSIYLKDMGASLEQIDCIKIYLHRMIESENHTLDHIL